MFCQKAHRVGIDVFKFSGNRRAFCQLVQSGLVVKRRAQMAVGKFRRRCVRIGVETAVGTWWRESVTAAAWSAGAGS